MRIKFGLPLLLVTFCVVLVCSLGSVSAANDIHDVTIDDTNTFIEHQEANIQDSTIYNRLISTDLAGIFEAYNSNPSSPPSTITQSRVHNEIISSNKFLISQATAESSVQNSMLNNVVNNVITDPQMPPSQIVQGVWDSKVQNSVLNNVVNNINGLSYVQQGLRGNVENSMINNAVSDFTGASYIQQGSNIGSVKDSMINNAVIGSSGESIIRQGFDNNNVLNSCLNNLVYGSEGIYTITQNNISNSLISNATLFSDNTTLTQTNLTGVNGCLIAIGCTNYTKTIDSLVNTNFFNVVIGNHVIFDLQW